MSKLKIEDIKRFVEIESNSGCKLISSEYINAHEPLLFLDKEGHPFTTNWNKFKSANQRQCSICGMKNIGMALKKNIDDVKNFIEVKSNSGCKLLSKEYHDVKAKIRIQCSCGNEFETSFDNFLRNSKRQCNICSQKLKTEAMKTPYTEIKNFIEYNSKNKLLTNESDYINTNKKISLKCECGNTYTTTFYDFKCNNKQQCNQCSQKLKIQHNLIKYGTRNPVQNKDVYNKIKNTLYKNGTAPCSKQQKYINNLYDGKLNYPYYNASLDIAFPNEKLYCEVDCGGHWLSVKLGEMTQEEFDRKARNRCYSLMRSGWKEMRIISSKDLLPSDSTLLNMLSYAKSYLQNHHYIKFDIDNSKVINSQGSFDYGYGELRQIKNTNLQEAS